jgi:UDP-N-acetyl-D-galactosamine dehydrogenase
MLIATTPPPRIAIIGLGYVGLPLAVEFGKNMPVVGFDTQQQRILELQSGYDRTHETTKQQLKSATQLKYSVNAEDLKDCNIYIVTVPTPVDAANRPDLSMLINASQTVGRAMRQGALVIYESTVYPGVTEEVCVPVLEQSSGLRFNQDFFCGYSPERVNPGDKVNTLTRIRKITSGSTPEAAEAVDQLYRHIIAAGTYKARSIKVAEAAKAIENTQRDLNIALMNELSILFDRLDIDTLDVLEAAGSKWNFVPFRPGLVGGHCIGVDPYYLTHKAQAIGYHPEVILAGRRINNNVGPFLAQRLVKLLIEADIPVKRARVGVLGLTFKEDVNDLRNSKVPDIIRELRAFGIEPVVHDPHALPHEAKHEYGLSLTPWEEIRNLDGLIVAVAHKAYQDMGQEKLLSLVRHGGVVMDVKSFLDAKKLDRSLRYWCF